MNSDPYTPDRGTVRYRYVDGDYSGGNRDPHAEFDRFIAKIKADALREAAEAWRKHLLTTDASYVCAESWLNVRAGWIEEEA